MDPILGQYLIRSGEQRYRLEPQPGEHRGVAAARSLLIKFKGIEIQDEAVKEKAASVLQDFLAGHTGDPDTVGAYIDVAAFFAEANQVDEVKKAFLGATDPTRRLTLRSILGSFGQTEAQAAALDLVFDESMPTSDLWFFFYSYGQQSEASRHRLVSWLEENYGELEERALGLSITSIMHWNASGAYQSKLLERMNAFYGRLKDPDGEIESALIEIQKTARKARADRLRGRESFDTFDKHH